MARNMYPNFSDVQTEEEVNRRVQALIAEHMSDCAAIRSFVQKEKAKQVAGKIADVVESGAYMVANVGSALLGVPDYIITKVIDLCGKIADTASYIWETVKDKTKDMKTFVSIKMDDLLEGGREIIESVSEYFSKGKGAERSESNVKTSDFGAHRADSQMAPKVGFADKENQRKIKAIRRKKEL